MSAFDVLAPTYDEDFTQQPIGKLLRAKVHKRLLSHFSAGDHVLEIGCGTGEDARFLAEQGITVTATDASEEMLNIAREKTQHLKNVRVQHMDLTQLSDTAHRVATYEGVFSNFGALNCLDDWQPLARWLSGRVKRSGTVSFGIMAPFCAWEVIWHALHWQWDIALRRVRGDTFGNLRVTYPTVKRITQDFAPYFERTRVYPLGLFLPTSALFNLVQKRSLLMKTLVSLESQFETVSQVAMLADHYWIEFTRN